MGEMSCLPPSESEQARMKYDSLKHEIDDLIEGARVVLAAKDAEIARLRAEVDRVRAQRDNAAKLLWGECEGDLGTGKGDVLLHGIGLHYDGDEVKEIEG